MAPVPWPHQALRLPQAVPNLLGLRGLSLDLREREDPLLRLPTVKSLHLANQLHPSLLNLLNLHQRLQQHLHQVSLQQVAHQDLEDHRYLLVHRDLNNNLGQGQEDLPDKACHQVKDHLGQDQVDHDHLHLGSLDLQVDLGHHSQEVQGHQGQQWVPDLQDHLFLQERCQAALAHQGLANQDPQAGPDRASLVLHKDKGQEHHPNSKDRDPEHLQDNQEHHSQDLEPQCLNQERLGPPSKDRVHPSSNQDPEHLNKASHKDLDNQDHHSSKGQVPQCSSNQARGLEHRLSNRVKDLEPHNKVPRDQEHLSSSHDLEHHNKVSHQGQASQEHHNSKGQELHPSNKVKGPELHNNSAQEHPFSKDKGQEPHSNKGLVRLNSKGQELLSNRGQEPLNSKGQERRNSKGQEHHNSRGQEHLSNKDLEPLSNKGQEHPNSKGQGLRCNRDLVPRSKVHGLVSQDQDQASLGSLEQTQW